MSQVPTQTGDEASRMGASANAPPEALGLVIAWSPGEPGRVGEVSIVPPTGHDATFILGRGAANPSDDHPRLSFVRNRAGDVESRPPLASAKISRIQLRIRALGLDALEVESVGRSSLLHNRQKVESTRAAVGDTLQLGQELLLLCVRRRAWVHSLGGHAPPMPFGAPDPHGIVGESPVAWEFRRQIAFVAPRPEHVLIVGESGTGKELAARAVHCLSPRGNAAFVARNAATFPEGLVDAELFGHARNYPNAGMPERQGLIAGAAGATLFLDEIAELSPTLQTHLLRVLDRGEYQRLGETTVRTSDFRLIAATNQPAHLRHDLLARLKLSLAAPSLNERIEDIPLLVVHLLRNIASSNADLAARLFPRGLSEEPNVAIAFIDALLRRVYRTHVRELEGLLWQALVEGSSRSLDRPSRPPSSSGPSLSDRAAPRPRTQLPSSSAIEAALTESDGSLERTWRVLGLTSRHALSRLMTKYGLKKPKE